VLKRRRLSHLTRRLSSPALACVRECAHLMKAEPATQFSIHAACGHRVPNGQIAPQLLKYFSEVQPFVRKLSCQASSLIPDCEQRRLRALLPMRRTEEIAFFNSRAQLAPYHLFYR